MPLSLDRQAIEGFSADQLMEFAEHLMREGEYFRAITEYRRFLFYYPHDPRQVMVNFRIGLAFYRGQSYADALQTFREVTRRFPDTPYGQLAWLWQGESLIRSCRAGIYRDWAAASAEQDWAAGPVSTRLDVIIPSAMAKCCRSVPARYSG
jgi:outer membrane protein assembly factor BamD (BamD/ComL family)